MRIERIAYVTRSALLVNRLQAEWMEVCPDSPEVVFKTYNEVYSGIVDQADFMAWYAREPACAGGGTSLDAEIIWQELRIRSGYDSDTEYLSLGQRQSRLDTTARGHICRFYHKYLASLGEKTSTLSKKTETLPYDFVMVDEAQDLSYAQLRNLYLGSRGQIVFMLGNHQIIFDDVSKLDYLKSLLYADGVVPQEIYLPTSYRCAEAIIKLANGLIALKAAVVGGGSDKHETFMDTIASLKGQGQFELRTTNKIEDLVGENPHQAIITLPHLKQEAQMRFQTALVFTIAEVKGLEFHSIVLWKLLTDDAAKAIARVFSSTTCEGTLHRPKPGDWHREYLGVCDGWITAVTRAKQRLIWVDDNK